MIQRTWMINAGNNFAFEIAAKPLQIHDHYLEPIGNYKLFFQIRVLTPLTLKTCMLLDSTVGYPSKNMVSCKKSFTNT